MIELGVDEITLVLQMSPDLKTVNSSGVFDWDVVAEDVIKKFEAKADLINVFGKKFKEMRAPNGYQTAYTYGEHVFYFTIAYHPLHMNMGIVVKFSAQSLDYYCERTGLKLYEILQKMVDPDYSIRLSRIDFTCDYVDEDVDTTKIYHDFVNRKIAIFREYKEKNTDNLIYKRCPLNYQGFVKQDEVPTIYLGSVQSNTQLRIYDKKREQLERKGTKYQKALNCNNWVRFEAIFKHEYAHQITEELLKIQTDVEFENLIACIIVQKYRFMKMNNGIADCETDYTQMLIDCINFQSFNLSSPSSKNYDLARSIVYIVYESGIMNTLYKTKKIWGDVAVSNLISYLLDFLKNWNPNDDCSYWLEKNADDYLLNYPTFDTFWLQSVAIVLAERHK